MKIFKYIIFFISVFLISSCNKKSDESINISAASSLKDCMTEIVDIYKKSLKNINIYLNFGASGIIQQQIEQGAPVDIFISAGKKQIDELEKKDLLLNKIVLIAPLNSSIVSIADLKKDIVKKIAIGEPLSVPVGQYTEEILTFYNLETILKDKLVYAKDVAEVRTWVETENVDAGFVYKTDALISNKIKIIEEMPENSHKKVIYPVSIIKSTKNEKSAIKFFEFLTSDEAKKIFEKYGFQLYD